MAYAARITGTGSAFPKYRMTNFDIEAKLAPLGIDTNDQWIRERTGIAERRISEAGNSGEHNSSLGLEASLKALEMADKGPEDIELIVYATCSPDTLLPSTACWLQHKLGAHQAWGMDINAACSGFVYGLATAEQFLTTGQYRTALVVGAEVLSPIINWEDRTSCILFGDAAGAAVVERAPADNPHRILSSQMAMNGNNWELLHMPAGGSNMEVTPERYHQKLNKVRMNGREIFKKAVRTLEEFALNQLERNGLTVEELDWFAPHQANIRIINAVAERIKVPKERVLVNIDRYGNTSAATIPTVLDEAVRDGRIQSGHTVLFDVFGAGLTYGAMLLRW
jgi:3-oxoacyl-[acyl-carrier-protein] synthase-3